jgi:hypothetical protein
MLETTSKSAANKGLARRLQAYLKTTLHSDVHLTEWDGTKRLPSFLGRRYRFYTGKIIQQPCLFSVDLDPENDTPAQISKHISIMQKEFPGVVVYTAPNMSATRRSRLIDARVAFVVPGNQLYVPALAVDLREIFRSTKKRGSDKLSPVAQATLFYSILSRDELEFDPELRTPSRMATTLSYSQMSIGRAFDELSDFGLATVEAKGRQKFLFVQEISRYFVEKHRELLRSPVQSRKFALCQLMIPPMKIAGESALSHLTGLSPPDTPVYALHSDDWKLVSEKDAQEVPSRDQADAIIELWHYRPDVLSEYANVDPLSLYAQFWDDPNERIAKSAREALEHTPW